MEEYVKDNNSNTTDNSSVVELNAAQQDVTVGSFGQKVDRFDFDADFEVEYRETQDGENKHALVSDLFKMQKDGNHQIYLKLCARDKYGYKVHSWQPCRFGLFVYVDVP